MTCYLELERFRLEKDVNSWFEYCVKYCTYSAAIYALFFKWQRSRFSHFMNVCLFYLWFRAEVTFCMTMTTEIPMLLLNTENDEQFMFAVSVFWKSMTALNTVLEQWIGRWWLWQYGLWSVQTGGTKLERFLPKNQHTQMKLLN